MANRILVVDDTPQNVKLLSDLLAAKGYEVSTAASGEQALESIAKQPPDLVLLDIMMPGISGYDVAARSGRIRRPRSFPWCSRRRSIRTRSA